MSGGFRRSSIFGIVGVIVVMVAVAAIALQYGSGAHPTGALIAIVAIVFGFIAVLMVLQRRDLDRVSGAAEREAMADVGPVADPTSVPPGALIAAMAVKPVDARALEGTAAAWGVARSSMNSGAVMVTLIFFTMAPWIIFQWKWSLIVGVPIIFVYLLFLVVRIVIPSGTVGKAFRASADMLSPLGLDMTSQPKVGLSPRIDRPSYSAKMVGTFALEGERHGRHVTMTRESDGPTTISVGGTYPRFTVKGDGDRLKAGRGAPPEVGRTLGSLSRSKRWKGIELHAGDDGIAVERRRDSSGFDWLCDLWLAERLADAIASGQRNT
jgi:hypothetical protein